MPPKQASGPSGPSRDSQFRSTAFKHARLLQDQKDLQNQILDTIIDFLDLPTSSTGDPGTPSVSDVARFKDGLAIFQQRDYDDLITERKISDKCGYVLCPRPVKIDKTTATDRIIWSKKGEDLKIVPRSELEQWCSKECADRAIFVRAQLNESPAWISGQKKDDILLLDEVRARKETKNQKNNFQSQVSTQEIPSITDGIRALALRDGLSREDEEALRKLQQLTLERGKTVRDGNLEDVNLIEKTTTGTAKAPAVENADGGSIEGYKPRAKTEDDDDDGDIMDL